MDGQQLDQDLIKEIIDDVSSFIASPQNDQVLKQIIEGLIKDLQDELKNVTAENKWYNIKVTNTTNQEFK